MPDFNNLGDLEKYLEKQVMQEAVRELAKETKRLIGDYIDKKWYKQRHPKIYNRTEEFINSMKLRLLPKTSKREYGFRIYFKVDKGQDDGYGGVIYDYEDKSKKREIKPHLPEHRKDWSAHADITAVVWKDGEASFDSDKKYNASYNIPIWIDKGVNSKIYSYEGINYVDYANRIVGKSKISLTKLKGFLTKKGYDVEIV